VWKHSFFLFCNCFGLKNDLREILSIFAPALATNIATPIGNSFMLKLIAEYWDDAVAWMAVLWRLIPVIFVYIFALSGSIWSIVGQNYWAWLYDRVRESIIKAMTIAWMYVLWMSALLIIFNTYLINLFNLSGEGAMLLRFYGNFLAIFFVFNAMIFVWNATFNVIGKAYISMIMNFLRSIVFLLPFIFFFSWVFWVRWILIWEALSLFLTGCIIIFILYNFIWNLKEKV
jgi:Na+-driven multidrug efflux pump